MALWKIVGLVVTPVSPPSTSRCRPALATRLRSMKSSHTDCPRRARSCREAIVIHLLGMWGHRAVGIPARAGMVQRPLGRDRGAHNGIVVIRAPKFNTHRCKRAFPD